LIIQISNLRDDACGRRKGLLGDYALFPMRNELFGTHTVLDGYASCVAGEKAYPNAAHYVAAKHAVIGIMKTLALELAPHDIWVNALLPGLVHTDMVFFPQQHELFSPDNPTLEGYLDVFENLQPMPGRWTEPEDQANGLCCVDWKRRVRSGRAVSPGVRGRRRVQRRRRGHDHVEVRQR